MRRRKKHGPEINLMDRTDIDAHQAGLEAETGDRQQRLNKQVIAVRRRSRLIKSLRTLFPVAIGLLVVGNFGWIVITSIYNSLNEFSGKSNEIRMVNPRYHGQTGKGEPYTISGLEAVRQGKDATTVTLTSPVLELKGDQDGSTLMSAEDGVFDQQTRQFTLTGNVVIESGASDFSFKTEEAIVDLNNSSVYGDKHVEGSGSVGHIVGESFVISDNGRSMQFRGAGDSKVWAKME